MELRHLEYFRMVAEELHFRRAAEKLHMSQPPLTRQIKQLEEELGVQLFNRQNRKVELTEAGAYLKKEIDEVFYKLESIRKVLRQFENGRTGQFKIGYISSTYHALLNDVLVNIKDRFPNLTTRLYEIPTIKQIKAIETDKLDVGIVRAPVASDQLNVIPLYEEGFALVFPSTTTLSFDGSVKDLTKFSKHPFIFFNNDYAPHYYNTLLGICGLAGFAPNVVHEANNVHSIVRMVENGLGISILPEGTIKQYTNNQVTFVTVRDIGYKSLVVAAYKKNDERAYIASFVSMLKQALIGDQA